MQSNHLSVAMTGTKSMRSDERFESFVRHDLDYLSHHSRLLATNGTITDVARIIRNSTPGDYVMDQFGDPFDQSSIDALRDSIEKQKVFYQAKK